MNLNTYLENYIHKLNEAKQLNESEMDWDFDNDGLNSFDDQSISDRQHNRSRSRSGYYLRAADAELGPKNIEPRNDYKVSSNERKMILQHNAEIEKARKEKEKSLLQQYALQRQNPEPDIANHILDDEQCDEIVKEWARLEREHAEIPGLYTFKEFKDIAQEEGIPVDTTKWWNRYRQYAGDVYLDI